MILSNRAVEMERYTDRFSFGSYLTFWAADETFAPLLHSGMHITIKLSEDMEQTEGLKLLRLGSSVYLAWVARIGDALYVNSLPKLRGTYSIEQAEDLPVAVLGNVVDIY